MGEDIYNFFIKLLQYIMMWMLDIYSEFESFYIRNLKQYFDAMRKYTKNDTNYYLIVKKNIPDESNSLFSETKINEKEYKTKKREIENEITLYEEYFIVYIFSKNDKTYGYILYNLEDELPNLNDETLYISDKKYFMSINCNDNEIKLHEDINYYLKGNKILNFVFLQWYMNKNFSKKLNEDYEISIVDSMCNIIELNKDEYIVLNDSELGYYLDKDDNLKNQCTSCGVDMGDSNPRQLCGKTDCLNN